MKSWLYYVGTFLITTMASYYRYVVRSRKWENDILYFIPYFGWFRALIKSLSGSEERGESNLDNDILGSTTQNRIDGSTPPQSPVEAVCQMATRCLVNGDTVSALLKHGEALSLLRASEETTKAKEYAEHICEVLDSIEEGLSPDDAELIDGMVRTLEIGNRMYVYDESMYRLREAKTRAEERYRELM